MDDIGTPGTPEYIDHFEKVFWKTIQELHDTLIIYLQEGYTVHGAVTMHKMLLRAKMNKEKEKGEK